MTNTLAILQETGIVGGKYNYSEVANAFLSMGYTSNAGNTYFNSMRFAEGIIIKEDVGQGYKYTFLNSIKIFSIRDKSIIAEKNFHSHIYNLNNIKGHVKSMLIEMLEHAANSRQQIINYVDAEIVISQLIDKAFSQDQREVALNQVKNYLN